MRCYFLVLLFLSNFIFAASSINDRDVRILENKNTIRAVAGDNFKKVTDLIDNKLQAPMTLSLNANIITISSSEVQLTRSYSYNTNIIDAGKKAISPISNNYIIISESTLNVQNGNTTGSFDTITSPTVASGDWVWIGFELNSSNKISIVNGNSNTTKALASYPAWTGQTAIGMLEVQCNSTCGGSNWDFIEPLETDVIQFISTGSGSTSNISYEQLNVNNLQVNTNLNANNAIISNLQASNLNSNIIITNNINLNTINSIDFVNGDSSLQCVNGSTTNAIKVKKGKIRVDNIEYNQTVDYSDLSIGVELTDNTNNYISFDTLNNNTLKVLLINSNESRYIPLCTITTNNNSIENIYNYASKNYDTGISKDIDNCYNISGTADNINSNNPYSHNLYVDPATIYCRDGMIYNSSTGKYNPVSCNSFISEVTTTTVTLITTGLGINERLSLKICYKTNTVSKTMESWDTCKTGQCWINNANKNFSSDASFVINFSAIPYCKIQVNNNGTVSYKNEGEGVKSVSTNSLVINSTWTSTLDTNTDSYKIKCGESLSAIETSPNFGNVISSQIITNLINANTGNINNAYIENLNVNTINGISSYITVQKFTSGSGTYTLPTSPKKPRYIKVKMVGGGGGGGCSTASTCGAASTSGGNTNFGGTLLIAYGGAGGTNNSALAAGGSYSISSPAVGFGVVGGYSASGSAYWSTEYGGLAGGAGGNSFFGGAGGGGGLSYAGGTTGVANTGGGGGGGFCSSTANCVTGIGGGAGGYVEAIISSPNSNYTYNVGTGGTGGTAGTYSGSAGAAGVIIVEEYYF